MKVNVVSKKLIRPYKTTPPHLRTYKISLIDELNPSMHVIRILFYPSDQVVNGKHVKSLEESLSQVLPLFYPLAGRYHKDEHYVDCNDEGAELSIAEVDCKLRQLIGPEVKPEQLNLLLPLEIGAADELTDPMLAVQINKFLCGGLAIGICSSHRIFDSCSQAIFLKAWSNVAIEGGLQICPDFDSPTYFPPQNIDPIQFGVSRTRDTSILTKRFVFDKNAIQMLRERLSPEWRKERPPSRVVVVSAVLSQAILRSDRKKHGKSRASIIGQAVNVRERTIPPISKYACGTWASMSFLESTADESYALECNFFEIVSEMRKVLIDCEFEAAQKSDSPDTKVIWISDWSKFEDYELDFGYGKPIWPSLADVPVQDFMILMNTKDNDGLKLGCSCMRPTCHIWNRMRILDEYGVYSLTNLRLALVVATNDT
ncbi:Pelargonidin 3-O-(6-caffeoylglucoside) 5-O-(6-O-malonylglucoside) 4'''-malonyltransferase [Sesamum angolense]|uniref:Pelargonidin 3-O-(6-caffeoylglucoside) 5-O-(6-O-malonylglucoside) 4'''-malonyltransferase n=1 Tax=Sesamum angolense TaxID=2727404 RepID=A0AAE1X7T1_9LAMI|nr:Pelargonidin 3-O-(6-caffeoylglucoside) 5-O-(6-O-malonylglucoside) 4'''-malonyltransferase [Sesamum angolense]